MKPASLVLAFALCWPCASWAAPPAAEKDAALVQVGQLLEQAQREIREFEKAGGRKDDARHPVAAWVEKLWAVRERHPGTAAAGKATAEAIHLLVHAERLAEVETRTDAVAPDDRAWESLGTYLHEAATETKDYRLLIRKLPVVIPHQRDPATRARLHYQLGRAYAKTGIAESAREAYRKSLEEAPDSPVAKDVQTALYELDSLAYGQPAPAFAAAARDHTRIALTDFRGRVVMLVFWAST